MGPEARGGDDRKGGLGRSSQEGRGKKVESHSFSIKYVDWDEVEEENRERDRRRRKEREERAGARDWGRQGARRNRDREQGGGRREKGFQVEEQKEFDEEVKVEVAALGTA